MIKKMMLIVMSMVMMASAMEKDESSGVRAIEKQKMVSCILVNSTKDAVSLFTNKSRKAVEFNNPLMVNLDGKDYTMNRMFILDDHGEKTIPINAGEAVYYANMQQDEMVDWYARILASVGARFMNTKDASFNYETIARGDHHFVVMTADVGRVYSRYAFTSKGDAAAFKAVRNQMMPFIKSLDLETKKKLRGESVAIIDQSKWSSLQDKFQQNNQIRSAYVFTPEEINVQAKPIVLFVIHGTWSEHAKSFKDIAAEWYQYVLRYAQGLAETKKTSIEVISYGWTGSNSTAERLKAAKSLALIISQIYKNYNIITVGHSHGCNVAIAASNLLEEQKIDLMINMAAPVRDFTNQEFIPKGVAKLVSFYSTSDMMQAAGALNLASLWESEGSVRKFQSKEGMSVYNIRTQINGEDPTHAGSSDGIRVVVHYLSDIMGKLNNFKYNNDLDMNIRSNAIEKDPILIAVRKYLTVDKMVMDPFLIKDTDTKDKLWQCMQQVKKEVNYSQQEEKRFEDIYERSIHYKASLAYRGVMGSAKEIIKMK
jgi:hypothetical protein